MNELTVLSVLFSFEKEKNYFSNSSIYQRRMVDHLPLKIFPMIRNNHTLQNYKKVIGAQ